ncbi:hypothetical protein IGJ74_001795 [Enterococcus sp. AZ009]|uniref:YopX family protein n=1 Tax=Enterococcus sp. AZ009 TaxID=2774766 RepID=UPI001C448336|nr:hypothetical protein [Enterococcus casseliflavus]
MVTKFRAWDKAINEMIPWRMLLNVYNLRNVFIRPETCGLVLMQSTGLKDKNGMEIFDGDLVKKFSNINKFTDDFAEDIEPIYVITSIVRDGACFKTTFKGVPSFVLDQNSMSMVEHMEVVGNIYENPELLETANES